MPGGGVLDKAGSRRPPAVDVAVPVRTTSAPERATEARQSLSADARHLLTLQRKAGNRAVTALVVQRRGGNGSVGTIESHVNGQAFQTELSKRVAELPKLGEAIPSPEQIEKAGQEGKQDGEALEAAQGRPALAEIAEKVVSSPAPVTDKGEAKPGFLSRLGSAVGAFFSGAKKAVTPSDVTSAKIGNAAETTAKIGYKAAATGGSLLGQTGNVAAGMGLIGQGAAMAVPAVTAITQIVPIINLLLAPLTICLNGFQAGKAWDRAGRLEELLAKAEAQAEAQGHPKAIIDAVRGAMDQKYEQAKRKAKLTLASMLSLTGSLLLLTMTLASNPIGWAIGASLALIGGAYGFYCAYRAIKKSFSKKDKGKKRREIALAIWNGLQTGDALAVSAVDELGLNPTVVAQKGGQDLLFARLTTG